MNDGASLIGAIQIRYVAGSDHAVPSPHPVREPVRVPGAARPIAPAGVEIVVGHVGGEVERAVGVAPDRRRAVRGVRDELGDQDVAIGIGVVRKRGALERQPR